MREEVSFQEETCLLVSLKQGWGGEEASLIDGPMGGLISGRVAIMPRGGCCPAHKCVATSWGSSSAGSGCNSCDNTKSLWSHYLLGGSLKSF